MWFTGWFTGLAVVMGFNNRWFAVVLLDGFCWMVFLIMEVLIDALDGRS